MLPDLHYPVRSLAITPGYFAAVGIPLLRGRRLEPGDAGEENIGVVVNRTLAEKCWPGRDPLGQIIRPNSPTPRSSGVPNRSAYSARRTSAGFTRVACRAGSQQPSAATSSSSAATAAYTSGSFGLVS